MKGFSLLEVLVALVILSLGLLSIAALQLSGLQRSQDAYLRTTASIQLMAMLDRLRANQSSSARDKELERWNLINARILPEGEGRYNCHTDECSVFLQWQAKQLYSLSLSAKL